MLMFASIGLIVIGGIGALVVSASSRKTQMSRFASSMGCRFVDKKENIITEITANKMDFFTQFVHRFENVITFPQAGTFIRVGDDIFYPEGQSKQVSNYTLLSAELMVNHFPSLKIEPISNVTRTGRYVPVRTNIEEIDKNYNIFLPPDTALNLSPAMCSFLKAQKGMYIESADNVCIMHSYKVLLPEEIQPFRFRALQLISDLEIVPEKKEEQKEKTIDAGTRAEAMITALMASHGRPVEKKKSSNGMLFLIILVVGGGMLFFAYYFLKHMVAR